jgi:hypothetical protein
MLLGYAGPCLLGCLIRAIILPDQSRSCASRRVYENCVAAPKGHLRPASCGTDQVSASSTQRGARVLGSDRGRPARWCGLAPGAVVRKPPGKEPARDWVHGDFGAPDDRQDVGDGSIEMICEACVGGRAADIAPHIEAVRAAGATSLRAALNARGIEEPRGGALSAAQVRRLLARQ